MPLRLAIGLLSAAALAYQLLLMRLFSIAQWHHLAFMVISLALLGYGASGAFLTVARRPLLARFETAFVAFAALFGLFAPACFALSQRFRLNPLELVWAPGQLGVVAAVYLILALPFFCAGSAIGLALARFEDSIHRLYRADLAGAAAGASAAIAVLYFMPASAALRLAGAAGGLAAGIVWVSGWASRRGRKRAGGRGASIHLVGPALAAAALLASAAWPAGWLEPRVSEYKSLAKALLVPGVEIVARRSGPLGEFAAVRSSQIPFRMAPGLSFAYSGEIPEQIVVFRRFSCLVSDRCGVHRRSHGHSLSAR